MRRGGFVPRRVCWLFFFVGLSAFARGPRQVEEEPQLLRLRVTDPTLILEVEGESRERTSRRSGGTTDADELIWDSSVGLTWEGSVYHPYLLDYWLYTELGYTVRDAQIRTGDGSVQDRDQDNQLQRYDGRLNILKKKPYATTLFGLRYDFDRRPDFFVNERVIGERYGVRSGYRQGPWPVEVVASHSDEDTRGSRTRDRRQDTVFVSTSNQRANNSRTRVSYTLDDIVNYENGRLTQDGPVQNFRLTDTTHFRSDGRTRLLSNLTGYDRDSTPVRSRSLTWRERLNVAHRPHVRGNYEYLYGHRENGPANSDIHQILASVQHRLFESLTSTADVDVYVTRDRGEGGSANSERYRGGFFEQYRKRLPGQARLRAGLGLWLWYTERQAEGELRRIIDERVQLTSGDITILQQPFVDQTSVVVTDTTGTRIYSPGLDYLLFERGDFTEIQRVIGGDIPDGSVVLVDYSVQAQPSGDYWTNELRSFVRYSLVDDLLSLYGRIEIIENEGGETLVLADVSRRIVGIETTLRWLRAGAEYESNGSDILPYEGVRLFQNFSVRPSRTSVLSLDFAQRWIDYEETPNTDEVYAYIGRYRIRPVRSLMFNIEGGYLKERRSGFIRDRYIARADVEFRMGKTIIRAGYEYEDDDLSEELRVDNRFWVRLRRFF